MRAIARAAASLSKLGSGSVGRSFEHAPSYLIPRLRGRHVHGRIGVGEPAVVVREQVVALARRQEFAERAPGFRKHVAHAVHEPVELGGAREKDAAQHEPEATLRMRLGIRERQRRAPRTAEEQPALDAEMPAQPLEVGHEMRRGVGHDLAAWRRAPRAALVEEHDAPERRVEIAAMMRQAAAAGTAVQEHERHAVRVAAGFPIQRVQRVDCDPARRVRVDLGKEDVASLSRIVRHEPEYAGKPLPGRRFAPCPGPRMLQRGSIIDT